MQYGNSSWRELLASPAPASHILQLYDGDAFLVTAVAHFAAEGLSRGDAALLTGTNEHLARVRARLEGLGVDAAGALHSGQLAVSDVHQVLAGGSVDAEARAALGRAREDGRFVGVRWWAEIANVLHHGGERKRGLAAERKGDAVAKQYGAAVLCSFMADKYDPRQYDDVLHELCCVHSHVVPAEDYARHRMAVNRAIAEVVGDMKGALLQSLTTWKGPGCQLPSSQALIFWLREALPEHFDAVLARAREHHLNQRPDAIRDT